METRLLQLAGFMRPSIRGLERSQQLIAAGDIFGVVFYGALFALAVIWLGPSTNIALDARAWWILALLLALVLLFERLPFFFNFELLPGRFASFEGALDGMVLWAGFFLYGPTVLWIIPIQEVINLVSRYNNSPTTSRRWALVRVFLLNSSGGMLSMLAACWLYTRIGGVFPIPSLRVDALIPALVAILTSLGVFTALFGCYLAYLTWAQARISPASPSLSLVVFLLQASGTLYLSHPFGILAAGIYVQNQQLASLLFFFIGMGLVAFIARQLSRSLETSRQQSRQMEQLEQLSRAIINSAPDANDLPDILAAYAPVMFPSARVCIWISGRGFVLPPPADENLDANAIWSWVQNSSEVQTIPAGTPTPWAGGLPAVGSQILAPVLEGRGRPVQAPLGFALVAFQPGAQPVDDQTIKRHVPVIQTLTDQVASALRQAVVYLESLSMQRDSDELRLAGEIQSSFFPDVLPELPGWQLAVTILPARETSGDFFDFIPLEDGRLGVLIADVTDKGVGPALYMALSRTLIRTYAIEYEADPDVVFFATNQRILQDARANLFVTVFYGILDPVAGELVYSNAGHNPPYLLRKADGSVEQLGITGMPIGLDEDTVWQTARVRFEPGDALLLYTDGIPDSVNEAGEFFDDAGMLAVASEGLGTSALEMQAMIIEGVQEFCGQAPQVDDITLIVITRDPNPESNEVV